MDKFLTKRPLNSDDESVIETERYQKCQRLASESMKPSKLKRHLVTKHPQFQHKEEDFFKKYENSIKVQKNTMHNFTSVPIKALAASLKASYLIAKTKKPHSIGESLVLPAAIKIVSIMHDFLFCQPLEGRTTENDIFVLINNFLEINEIPWSMCVSICIDGAAALTGSKKGFKAKVLEVSSNIKFNHCMIHREALASKKLQPDVNKVLLNAINVINFIKSKSLNSRIFTILCNEMGSDHEKLLLHTEVRWLSRGKILSHLFELRDEARIFLLERNNTLSEHFLDEQWLAILGYLADIFEKLNCLNLSLQGRNLKISEELIDLSSDENLRIRFQENTCDTFWISIKSEYPELSKQTISILLSFASTYLCETAFSTLTIIKNKYRSRLNVEADL
ncbi:SCAN domain-containing protein 3-like [Sipha flava]|uniref:SCAN domain-containing protein 3-like n=1 Tax=Sipha flava TaxID=143950 RepID=A0A8B8FYT0_9HEMI|nr:SCAN domain-containing protein 3-like [Sipha flava]